MLMGKRLNFIALTILIFEMCWTQRQPFEPTKKSGTQFPYFQYYENTNHTKRTDERVVNHLCRGRKTDTESNCCSCQDGCVETKNCCIDKFWNGTLSLDRYLEEFVNQMRSENGYEYRCNPLFERNLLRKFGGGTSRRYLMVSQCNVNSKVTEHHKKCASSNYTKMVESIPVLSKDGVIYRSKSCAICNNVKEYTRFNISMTKCTTDGFNRNTGDRNLTNWDGMVCIFGLSGDENLI